MVFTSLKAPVSAAGTAQPVVCRMGGRSHIPVLPHAAGPAPMLPPQSSRLGDVHCFIKSEKRSGLILANKQSGPTTV